MACAPSNSTDNALITTKLHRFVLYSKSSEEFDNDLSMTFLTIRIRSRSNWFAHPVTQQKNAMTTNKLHRCILYCKSSDKFGNDLSMTFLICRIRSRSNWLHPRRGASTVAERSPSNPAILVRSSSR